MSDIFFSAGCFFPGIYLHAFFLPKSACRTFFFLKLSTTPSKVKCRPLKSTKHLVSWHILICQSFLKAFETIGDKTLKGRIRFYLPLPGKSVRSYVRWTYGDVITKFSRIDSLPNFITRGGPLRALRARRLRYQYTSCCPWTKCAWYFHSFPIHFLFPYFQFFCSELPITRFLFDFP